MSRHADTIEQGVAHKHSKPASVAHNRFGTGGIGRGRVQHRTGVLPLVDQAAVDAAHDQTQPGDDVLQLLSALILGDGTVEAAERLGQVAQQDALVTHDAELLNVPLEVRRAFQHVSEHRFRPQIVIARPRHRIAILRERRVQQIFQRLGIRDVGDALQALVIVHAVHLHLRHGGIARLALLRTQHLSRIFQGCLDHRYQIERVLGAFGVEELQRRQQKRR